MAGRTLGGRRVLVIVIDLVLLCVLAVVLWRGEIPASPTRDDAIERRSQPILYWSMIAVAVAARVAVFVAGRRHDQRSLEERLREDESGTDG